MLFTILRESCTIDKQKAAYSAEQTTILSEARGCVMETAA